MLILNFVKVIIDFIRNINSYINLIYAFESRVKALIKKIPRICFNSINSDAYILHFLRLKDKRLKYWSIQIVHKKFREVELSTKGQEITDRGI